MVPSNSPPSSYLSVFHKFAAYQLCICVPALLDQREAQYSLICCVGGSSRHVHLYLYIVHNLKYASIRSHIMYHRRALCCVVDISRLKVD